MRAARRISPPQTPLVFDAISPYSIARPHNESFMNAVIIAFARALWSQLHPRMLWLTVLPFLLALVSWGLVLWLCLQPMIDGIRRFFVEHDGFRIAGNVLAWVGLVAIKTVIVPLIAMWILLPLMIATALIFISLFAMPAIERHVARRHFPTLEKRHGGNLWRSIGISSLAVIAFLVAWLLTLPIAIVLPFGFVIQAVLWGWLTCHVMTYDALAEHADSDERMHIQRTHRWPLLMIGIISGAMGTAPMLIWMGGVLSVVLLPFFAAVSIWLYLLVFVFTGLWFQHYCLTALASYRSTRALMESDHEKVSITG